MATISKAQKCNIDDSLCQGDVFRDVKYCYLDSEEDDYIDMVEFTFPMAVIVSQACDVIAMSKMITAKAGKTTKFMPSILMCPIYSVESAKKSAHIEDAFKELSIENIDGREERFLYSDDKKVANKDWHYRFHLLDIKIGKTQVVENAVVDFKHYFTVPATYLIKHRDDRLFKLDDVYAEQITLKFATFLSRVAMPDP